MKNLQKGFANIILIALVVIFAGALGYVTLVKKPAPAEQQLNITESAPNTLSVAPVSTDAPPQADETAGWKTYANTKVDFSFKYPSQYVIDDFYFDPIRSKLLGSLSLYDSETSRQLSTKSYVGAFSGFNNISIKATNKKDLLLNLQLQAQAPEAPEVHIEQSSISSFSNSKGIEVVKFKCRYEGDGGGDYLCYIIPRKPDFSSVLHVRTNDPIFENILSTFEFIPIILTQ